MYFKERTALIGEVEPADVDSNKTLVLPRRSDIITPGTNGATETKVARFFSGEFMHGVSGRSGSCNNDGS